MLNQHATPGPDHDSLAFLNEQVIPDHCLTKMIDLWAHTRPGMMHRGRWFDRFFDYTEGYAAGKEIDVEVLRSRIRDIYEGGF